MDFFNYIFRGFLYKFDLFRNRFYIISNDIFRNFRGFQYLDFSFNELVYVLIDFFKGLNEF